MKTLRVVTVLFMAVVLVNGSLMARRPTNKPLIQMAILLDTSGSMEGLIGQAKTQLWKIVNEMAMARKWGCNPRLEVALYEYGKSSLPASEGFMRMIVPLTTDLDRISEELFRLRTNGGSEYCGRVIWSSLQELRWSQRPSDYKVIFIAGNEPFTQGNVDYRKACAAAIGKGVIVNTVFCGHHQQGIRTFWKHGAELADGSYMSINHNRKIVHLRAPQDREIVMLGRELNKTYLAFGPSGHGKKERQAKQDSNALSLDESVMVQRSITKASTQYNNSGWDLVDAEKEGKIKVGELAENQLPQEMKGLDQKGRREYLQKMAAKRKRLQAKIQQLKKQRESFLATKKQHTADQSTLDKVLVETVRKQAGKKQFTFKGSGS